MIFIMHYYLNWLGKYNSIPINVFITSGENDTDASLAFYNVLEEIVWYDVPPHDVSHHYSEYLYHYSFTMYTSQPSHSRLYMNALQY